MIRSMARVLWRAGSELLLGMFAAVALVRLKHHGAPEWMAVGALAAAAVPLALRAMARTLRFAWSCPRLDALGLPVAISASAWRAATAGEAVLALLDGDARGYRNFFPGGRRDVSRALRPALAPDATPAEIDEVAHALQEIATRLRSLRPGRAVEDPLEALAVLHARSGALAEAVDELRPGAAPVPADLGGRR